MHMSPLGSRALDRNRMQYTNCRIGLFAASQNVSRAVQGGGGLRRHTNTIGTFGGNFHVDVEADGRVLRRRVGLC